MHAIMISLLINSAVVGVLALFTCAIGPVAQKIPAAKRVRLCLLFSVLLVLPLGMVKSIAPLHIEASNPAILVESPFENDDKREEAIAPVPPTQAEVSPPASQADGAAGDIPTRVYYKFNAFALAAAIWLAGAGTLLLFEMLRWLYWRHKIWRWREPLCDPDMLRLVSQEKEALGNIKSLKSYTNPMVKVPLVTGIFRHNLLLPEDIFMYADARMIVRHELSHLCSRDIVKKLVFMTIRCVHWFNPLVWIMTGRAGRDIELACDERVVDGRDDKYRLAYSETLLTCAKAGFRSVSPALSTCFGNDKKSLLERFQNMLNTGKRYKGRIAVGACFIIALLVVNLIFVSPATRQSAQLVVPESGENFSVWVGREPGKMVATSIPAPSPATPGSEAAPNAFSAASYGRFISVACAPGTMSTDAVTLYTTTNGGKEWAESRIDVQTHMDFVGGPIFHGYTSKQFGYVFVQGAKQQLSKQGLYLYQTIDGGKNWQIQNFTSNEHLSVVGAGFIDEYTGLICYTAKEGMPYALATYDGGINWQPVEGLEDLIDRAFGAAADVSLACVSADFVEGARLVYTDNFTGFSLVLSSADGQKWKAAGWEPPQ